MTREHEKIWELALPYLKKGVRKDFVVHTRGVVQAMERLLEWELGDPKVLIPAAILHDVGWANVDEALQKNWANVHDRIAGEQQHLNQAAQIIPTILDQLDFDHTLVSRIVEVVLAHKFQKPKQKEKQLLIDADALSDILKEPFYADAKAYGVPLDQQLLHRKGNSFFTQTAKTIFRQEFLAREREVLEKTGKKFFV